MAHEELRKQYEEDCKNHKRPWELWQFKLPSTSNWVDFISSHPKWRKDIEYRRKEPPFQPEYFSGLNWRDAEKLVGKVVEFVDNPDFPWTKGVLVGLSGTGTPSKFVKMSNITNWLYIRTTPETYQDNHPTITIGGVELPRPEVEAPKYGAEFWVWFPNTELLKHSWEANGLHKEWLSSGMVHLTKANAQAWDDWWRDCVIKGIKG